VRAWLTTDLQVDYLAAVVFAIGVNTVRDDVLNPTIAHDAVDLRHLGLPLRTAVTGVAAGSLPLRNGHCPSSLLGLFGLRDVPEAVRRQRVPTANCSLERLVPPIGGLSRRDYVRDLR